MQFSPIRSHVSTKAAKGLPSGIAGLGLFAVAPIRSGEIVAIKGGHIVDSHTLSALPLHLRESEIQIADGWHLCALSDDEYEPVMLFINHSCEPNVGFAGNVVLVAMRDVPAGEELTIDYALCDVSEPPMACLCRTPSCRGVVAKGDWRSSTLQDRYGPYFSTYLQTKIGRYRDDMGHWVAAGHGR